VPVRRWVSGSVSWARLEDAGQLPLSALLGSTPPCPPSPPPSAGSEGGDRGRWEEVCTGDGRRWKGARVGDSPHLVYLHDWSLPQNLGVDSPLLKGMFQVPRYFAGDLLQRVAGRGLPYTDSWPSLFVGPKGTKSDTHVDSFGWVAG
ncbi:unnamed protein product, partial [Discosporangium mesarthrocarpum]